MTGAPRWKPFATPSTPPPLKPPRPSPTACRRCAATGSFLVSYDAFKRHYSVFPASEAVIEAGGEELKPYLAGKGTIQFPADQPIPTALITRLVKARVEENAAVAAAK